MENLAIKIQMKKYSASGFTLIELLVVIAIVGLLASIVSASLNSARAKSRDAKRRSDLVQLRTALELYYNSHGNYPVTTTWYGVDSLHDTTYVQRSGPLGWIPDLAPEAISVLPVDPRSLGLDSAYHYYSTGQDYKLLAFRTVEAACPLPSSDGMYDPMRNASSGNPEYVKCTFAVYTPGAAGW